MITVDNINEEGINTNLRVRYRKDLIYVRRRPAAAAAAPYRWREPPGWT